MRKCSYCGGIGHNRATCPKRIADELGKQKIKKIIFSIICIIIVIIGIAYGYLFLTR